MERKVDPHTNQIHVHLMELERAAEELLTDKRTIVDLDRKRNDNRVALRQIGKSDSDKQWIAMGNTFFRFEKEQAKQIIQEDQKETEVKIKKLHDEIKKKYAKIQDIEGKPVLKGLDLKPLNDEIGAMLPNRPY